MDSKAIPTPTRVYQDFEPSMEWVPEDDSDTLLVYLPGFSKEQLRVQLRARNLIISGERKLQNSTWNRFRVEFPVSVNCDLNRISAKFEGNILFVKQPKLITQEPKPDAVEEKAPVVAEPLPAPQKLVDEPNLDQKASAEKPTPTTQPNTEIKNVQDDLQKTEVEEKSKKPKDTEPKTKEKAVENKSTADLDNKNKKVVQAELDKTTKTALENYKLAVGVFATKLKTSKNAVNAIVVLLIGLVIGIYLSDSIKSWTKA
ncbi:uncharacterized protein [Rutidosis leptorrhynchoides]|uniref:uncharacterized protein n=1 Tax=Rutidosis leptorrhynchoides TaxID=125765 RepID=UPI003A99B7D6